MLLVVFFSLSIQLLLQLLLLLHLLSLLLLWIKLITRLMGDNLETEEV